MTIANKKQNGRNFFSRFRRGQSWKEYAGYHVGDIYETQPIAIPHGSTVVGNILAPQIVVLGLLSGTAVGRDVVIYQNGQIWGDVHAVRFQLEPGAKIRGWVNSLTEAEFAEMAAEATALVQPPDAGSGEPPDGLKPEHKRILDSNRLDTLHQLQIETAVALAARTELETSFEQRLSELAGEATNQVSLLRAELKQTKGDLAHAQETAEQTAQTLENRESQLKRQGEELALAQERLAGTTEALEKLQRSHAELEEQLGNLRAAKAGVDTHLEEALNHVDTLSGRVHNIETALQASLIHSSDQEDALLRWQELAETTESNAQSLEEELKKVKHQLAQNNDLNTMLRNQKKDLEKEWGKAHARIGALEKQLEEEKTTSRNLLASSDATIKSLTDQLAELKQNTGTALTRIQSLEAELSSTQAQLITRQEEVTDARLRYKKLRRKWQLARQEMEGKASAGLTTSQVREIEQQLAEAREQAENHYEQMLWHQTNLETTQREVNELRRQLEQQKKESAAELESAQASLKKTRNQLKQQKADSTAELNNVKASLQETRNQLEAAEEEMTNYLKETAQQGQRLAEAHVTLVEYELQLKQAKQTIVKQQQFIKKMQQITRKKVQSLEQQLRQK